MTERRPLVQIAGEVKELPSGDTLPGGGGGGGSVAINDLVNADGSATINVGTEVVEFQINGSPAIKLDGSAVDPTMILNAQQLYISGSNIVLAASVSIALGDTFTPMVAIAPSTLVYVSFHGATGAPQCSAIPDPTGGTTEDTECRAALAALLAYLRTRGDVSAA